MLPARFHTFALEALAKAPDVQSVDNWDRGDHTHGIKVTFSNGSQVWFGMTLTAAPGARGDEDPVITAPPAAEVAYPQLYEGGTVTPERAEQYLAAAITNSGHAEVKNGFAYGPDTQHPGFGVVFHSGAKIYCLIHHTARMGQDKGSRAFQLQEAF